MTSPSRDSRAPGCILTAAADNPPTKMQTRRQRPQDCRHGGAATTIPTAGNLQEVGHHHAASEVQRTPSRYKATRAPGCILTAWACNPSTKMQTRRPRPQNWCQGGAATTIPTAGNLHEVGHHHRSASEVQPMTSPSNSSRAPGCILTAAADNPHTKMQTSRPRPQNGCHGGAATTIPTAGNLQEVGNHHATSEVQPMTSPSRDSRAPGCSLTAAADNPPTKMQTRRQRPQNWRHGGAATTIPTASILQEVGHHHAASEVQRTPSPAQGHTRPRLHSDSRGGQHPHHDADTPTTTSELVPWWSGIDRPHRRQQPSGSRTPSRRIRGAAHSITGTMPHAPLVAS